MSADRDQLAEIISDNYQDEYGIPADGTFVACADAIVAAGWRPPPRRIETVMELDALQSAQWLVDNERCGQVASAAVIRDADGDVYTRDVDNVPDEIRERRHAGWWQTGVSRDDIDSSTVRYPVTVLWSQEAGDA